jgi:chemotaxis protein MotB
MAQKGQSKPRKKKEEPEKPQNAERWLLTYSDMITLLMVLFVVLYAQSKVDTTKFNALAESLSIAFSSVSGVQAREGDGGHSLSPTDAILTPPPGTGMSPKVSSKRDPFLEKARSTLASDIRTGNITVSTEARGIVLALAGDTFFKVGSANLEEGAIGTLSKVAELLRSLPNPIAVEGHSDNSAMTRGDPMGSNLMLSAARAVAVTEALELLDLPKERLSATGFGDAKPARPNDTPEGRAYNRRVEILIRFDAES